VIPGFMIQGGGYTADMQERETKSIKGEFLMNGCRTNTLKHTRGVLSMARTSVPDSASSQFFVMHENSPHLDGQYAAFGKVVEGLEVIDKIANVETGNYGWYMQDVPVNTVEIEKVEVISE
jgi:peptidyl-prolyl cis-trans isomerase B (cyclophilin B)